MPSRGRPTLPDAAMDWLVGSTAVRVIGLGCSRAMIERLIGLGHQVVTIDADPTRLGRLWPRNGAAEQFIPMAGRADALPVQPCTAQVVLIPGNLTPASQPIDRSAAHAQISRALAPGGWAAGWRISRDDSVPWVRRLITLMRGIDASAMSGQTPANEQALLDSKYFPRVEQRDFRLWVPISRSDLFEMVTSQPGVAKLTAAERSVLLAEASQIFDSAARISELRLPYQLHCWQAHVDHHELTQPITFSDGALVIPL